ncbi:type I restriction enzyme HsdR N-terminal domain-containing protein [Bacteroidales bacterium OttesenSCG-928-L03]|nr:type I restriction enzyme HsdR N-terminal domain-containing protein [Bacteroidales bacterium OttesenSCG-928-L03]
MYALNLPDPGLKLQEKNGKLYVFDRLRKQFVRFTPEEQVRQSFIAFLIDEKGYPEGLLANEVSIELGNVKRRCDTVLYDVRLAPLMIVEYKAPSVVINQGVFDQIARYTLSLPAPWLIISNGLQHFCCRKEAEKKGYSFVKEIPSYSFVLGKE